MICPLCNYAMDAFDKECPRCHGKGVGAPAVAAPIAAPAPFAPQQVAPAPPYAAPTPGPPLVAGPPPLPGTMPPQMPPPMMPPHMMQPAVLPSIGCLSVLGGFILALLGMMGVIVLLGYNSPLLVVVLSAVWVGIDANAIGARRGLMKGLGDADTAGWVVGTVLFWAIVFPAYIMARPIIKQANGIR